MGVTHISWLLMLARKINRIPLGGMGEKTGFP